MADDAAYNATMNTLCHIYVDRDTLLNYVAKETSERSRYLMVAAALWSTANESAAALSQLEHSAPHLDALRQAIATNIASSRLTSYAFYCNALASPTMKHLQKTRSCLRQTYPTLGTLLFRAFSQTAKTQYCSCSMTFRERHDATGPDIHAVRLFHMQGPRGHHHEALSEVHRNGFSEVQK